MPETFIELIPRCDTSLQQSMTELEASGIPFDGYNIPELIRKGQTYLSPEDIFRLRSEGKISSQKQLAVHLRSRERTVRQTLDRLCHAAGNNVNIALLVTGDPLEEETQCTHAHEVICSDIQSEPMRIGVAADIYQPDWGRWDKKIPAIGKTVDAVFTQPIFSASVLDDIDRRTRSLMKPDQLYAGITWITTERSRRYWQEQNHVPPSHLPQGDGDGQIIQNSIAQAADVLRAVKQQGYSTYIMLMHSTMAQLECIFSLSENIREI